MLDLITTDKMLIWFHGFMVGSYVAATLIFVLRWSRKKRAEKRMFKIADEILGQIFPKGNVTPPEIKRAVLTKEMQERGPVPDVPAIKWTRDALAMFAVKQGFDINSPIDIAANMKTGDVILEQVVKKP